jgi:SLOG in TRPM, prokaryote
MEKPVKFPFSNGRGASSIRVQHVEELPVALHELGLRNNHPVLVLIGGASKTTIEQMNRLRSLFAETLAPVAAALDAAIVDGGTDTGIMQLMGQARASLSASFPLIGVVPIGKVAVPGITASHSQATPLEPHHTHFVLVPGMHFGDESTWIAHVASVLSSQAHSLTILINGGEITWKDAEQSVEAGRRVLIIEGSGRTADALARAVCGEAADERAKRLVASGLLQVVDLTENSAELARLITNMLST